MKPAQGEIEIAQGACLDVSVGWILIEDDLRRGQARFLIGPRATAVLRLERALDST